MDANESIRKKLQSVFGVTELPDVHIEAVMGDKIRLWTAVEKSSSAAGQKVPMVFHRRTFDQWMATLPLSDIPRLVDAVNRSRS